MTKDIRKGVDHIHVVAANINSFDMLFINFIIRLFVLSRWKYWLFQTKNIDAVKICILLNINVKIR